MAQRHPGAAGRVARSRRDDGLAGALDTSAAIAAVGVGWVASNDFRSAVLLAANLGQDSDTTVAIAGQLAGAVYEAAGIPAEWLDAVAWRHRLADMDGRLFDAAWPEDDVGAQTATWITPDWSLRERLEALARSGRYSRRRGLLSQ